MRRLLALASRPPALGSYGLLAMFAAVLSVWLQYALWALVGSPQFAMRLDLIPQLGLLITFGVTFFAWSGLHAFGLVGAGSGAGFRLMCLGLAARVEVAMCVLMTGGEASGSIYDALPATAGPVWWVRNLSLVAYGCGLTLVVLASIADLRRRRHRPRWMPVLD